GRVTRASAPGLVVQGAGLFDPFVALDATLEVQGLVDADDVLLGELGDLAVVVDADLVELLLQNRTDAGNLLQVVGLAVDWRGQALIAVFDLGTGGGRVTRGGRIVLRGHGLRRRLG